MKTFLAVFTCAFLAMNAKVEAQAKYRFPLLDISNDTIDLTTDSIKTMYIVVPLSSADSLYTQLSDFKSQHADTALKIIGIISIEDGYQVENLEAIKTMYNSIGIRLTQPLYTRKTAIEQSPLPQWLTHKELNNYYDDDIAGIGHKFFVNAEGGIHAVLCPEIPLNSPLVSMLVDGNVN
jgi:hypothetical protein